VSDLRPVAQPANHIPQMGGAHTPGGLFFSALRGIRSGRTSKEARQDSAASIAAAVCSPIDGIQWL
jgi:hypothetical protein